MIPRHMSNIAGMDFRLVNLKILTTLLTYIGYLSVISIFYCNLSFFSSSQLIKNSKEVKCDIDKSFTYNNDAVD